MRVKSPEWVFPFQKSTKQTFPVNQSSPKKADPYYSPFHKIQNTCVGVYPNKKRKYVFQTATIHVNIVSKYLEKSSVEIPQNKVSKWK
jgi:hypothetical protein